ncbi:hypothetical protein STVA_37860 [Allostella vacuolata]|nr:hypothetical protein STVA_37860 [Stella vacuolata]
MPSVLEIILVALVVALFFGASRVFGASGLTVSMRELGRAAGRATRGAAAPAAGPAGKSLPALAAPPRPPAAG